MKKYPPEEYDSTTAMLRAMHIHEDEHFIQRVHDDIDSLIAGMKVACAGRVGSTPDTSAVEELKDALDEAAHFKGSRLEQLVILFCKQTKLKYSKLSNEEKQWLIRIARKSEPAKGYISQRGKKIS